MTPLAPGSSYFWVEGHKLLRGHQEKKGGREWMGIPKNNISKLWMKVAVPS